MLATYARYQAEEAQGIDTDKWWLESKEVFFALINVKSKQGLCLLQIDERSEANIDNWIGSYFCLSRFQREMKTLGYDVEVISFHDIVFEVKVRW